MWPFLDPVAWVAYLRSQGIDPDTYDPSTIAQESFICEICKVDLPPMHVSLEPPPGLPFGRKFHVDCLVKHLCDNLDNLDDEISNYAMRKPLS